MSFKTLDRCHQFKFSHAGSTIVSNLALDFFFLVSRHFFLRTFYIVCDMRGLLFRARRAWTCVAESLSLSLSLPCCFMKNQTCTLFFFSRSNNWLKIHLIHRYQSQSQMKSNTHTHIFFSIYYIHHFLTLIFQSYLIIYSSLEKRYMEKLSRMRRK